MYFVNVTPKLAYLDKDIYKPCYCWFMLNIERVRDLVFAWRSIIPNNKTGLNKHAAQMKQLDIDICL